MSSTSIATMMFAMGIFTFLAFQVGPILRVIAERLATIVALLQPKSPSSGTDPAKGITRESMDQATRAIERQTTVDQKIHDHQE